MLFWASLNFGKNIFLLILKSLIDFKDHPTAVYLRNALLRFGNILFFNKIEMIF